MFHIGQARRRTPDERRRHRRRQIRNNPRPIRGSVTGTEKWNDFVSFQRWNILPLHCFEHKGLYYAMCFDHPKFAQRYTQFQNFGIWPNRNPNQTPLFQMANNEGMNKEAKEKYFLNQKVRWAFKRLLQTYLLRKMQVKNDVDPITLDTPQQAVTLVDMRARSKFIFEAKSILRDFQTRLLNHSDLFPMPLFLRNPLTNERLTIGQIQSILDQSRRLGQTHWTTECLIDARFELKLFSRDNSRKLKLHALRDLMISQEGSDFILDFIEGQHDVFNKFFDERTYTWALKSNRCYSMTRIRAWREMCQRFYEIEITTEDYLERNAQQQKLSPILINLCSPCHDLLEVRRSFRRLKL